MDLGCWASLIPGPGRAHDAVLLLLTRDRQDRIDHTGSDPPHPSRSSPARGSRRAVPEAASAAARGSGDPRSRWTWSVVAPRGASSGQVHTNQCRVHTNQCTCPAFVAVHPQCFAEFAGQRARHSCCTLRWRPPRGALEVDGIAIGPSRDGGAGRSGKGSIRLGDLGCVLGGPGGGEFVVGALAARYFLGGREPACSPSDPGRRAWPAGVATRWPPTALLNGRGGSDGADGGTRATSARLTPRGPHSTSGPARPGPAQ